MTIHFDDLRLEVAVRERAGCFDEPLTQGRVAQIHSLDLSSRDIRSVRGIEILSNLKSLRLRLSSASDLELVSHLQGLVALECLFDFIPKLGFLESLARLEMLSLHTSMAKLEPLDLSPLKGLTGLRELRVDGFSLRDVEPLKGLGCLEVVSLSRGDLVDVAPVTHLPRLRALEISHNDRTSDMAQLAGGVDDILAELGGGGQEGNQARAERRWRLSDIARCRGLRRLALQGNGLVYIAPLGRLVELEELDLRDNPLETLEPLLSMTRLRVLWVDVKSSKMELSRSHPTLRWVNDKPWPR